MNSNKDVLLFLLLFELVDLSPSFLNCVPFLFLKISFSNWLHLSAYVSLLAQTWITVFWKKFC